MILRLPESGSLVASLLSGLGQVGGSTGGDAVDDVSPEQLDEALATMQRGEIEYVIVEDGDDFIQAAGDGDVCYQVEVSTAGTLQGVRGGADAATTRAILQAYLQRRPDWRSAPWAPIA